MIPPVLELRNITKLYGDFRAVDDVSFQLQPGEVYGFLGPNGAGKTTTIRMILDIIRPTQGSIQLLGAASALAVRHRIGYLPEEKGLYKKMKAWSIIAYFGTLKGLSKKVAKDRAHELLERYGLKDFAEQKTEALSKGMGQKVQVLASIVHDPEFVILDEPFSGLDPVNQQVMEEIIRDLALRGRTVLFSTHVMQHAERLCRKILLIARGKKLFDGSLEEARRTLPRRVRVTTADAVSIETLETLDGVTRTLALESTGPEAGNRWELHLREGFDAQEILQTAFRSGLKLRAFEQSEPTLHEVFMNLVGPGAREASFR